MTHLAVVEARFGIVDIDPPTTEYFVTDSIDEAPHHGGMNLSYPSYSSLIGTLGASVVLLIGLLAAVWRLLHMKHRTMLAKVQIAHQRIQRQGTFELEQALREIMSLRREIDVLSRKLRDKSNANGLTPDPAIRTKPRSASFIVVDEVLGTALDDDHGFSDTAIMPEEPWSASRPAKRRGAG